MRDHFVHQNALTRDQYSVSAAGVFAVRREGGVARRKMLRALL
jgi:hypothetical protein